MQTWLLNAPRWVVCVVNGLLFGSSWVVLSRVVSEEPWAEALVGGVVGGGLFGLAHGWRLHRQNSRTRERLGAVSPSAVRAAVHAARRGMVPDDPEVRAAALGVVEDQQATLRSQRALNWVLWPVMTAVTVSLAVTSSPRWWVVVPLVVGFLVLALVVPRRLEREARVLRGEPQPH